jgi:hypothetical protein
VRAALAFAPAQITAGLWRWEAQHPDWRPGAVSGSSGDWEPIVGCVLYLTGAAAVFIDPLLPGDTAAFWSWADPLVAGAPVHVLTTIRWHRRSRDAVAARYGAATSRARRRLPAGVESIVLRGAGETMFWLPAPRALVPGDRIIGAPGGGLRLCPDSWLTDVAATGADLRALLAPLASLPVDRVLVSHGRPVLRGAQRLIPGLLAA